MAQQASNIAQDVTYTYYWDSASRDKTCSGPPDNPTNPVTLQVQLSRFKAPFSQLYLASLELPKLSQYTVESTWNQLYFSEGLQLVVSSAAETCVREFTVLQNQIAYTGILPAFLNPVVTVTGPGTTTPVLEFAYEHGLEILAACPSSDPIRLISTNVAGNAALASNFTIIDAFSVQLNLAAPVAWGAGPAPYGYLYAPTITTPVDLACRVTAALNVVAPGEFQVTYDTTTGLFSFQVLRPNRGETCSTASFACPPRGRIESCLTPTTSYNQDTVAISIPGSACLPYIMGFGQCSSTITVPQAPPYTVTGQYGFCPCESRIVVPPGNYDAVALGSALNSQLNSFYFNGGCANDPSKEASFVFNDICGLCHSILVPYGQYNPNTFASYLASQMNLASPGHGFVVSWDPVTQKFCFETTDGSNFSLEFAEAGTSNVASRLGFSLNSFRGANQYCSNLPLNVPVKNCCTAQKFLTNVYEISVNGSTQQYSINVTQLPCQEITGAVALAPHKATITTALANGVQVNDVVSIEGVEFVITQVIDAFDFVIELGSHSIPLYGDCLCPSEEPVLNLFFAPAPCQQNPIKPALLGFFNDDVLFQAGQNIIMSPSLYNLDHPPYLLLQVKFPDGLLTRNSHTNEDQQTLNFILAKIIIYPNFKNERIFPFNGFIQQLAVMNKLTLELLNPDHSVYKFHGCNWSGTLCFLVPESSTKMVLY